MQNPAAPPAGVQPGSSLIKPPELPDDVVEEILARFPPDDPALLVRAALVCKGWWRIVSSAGFRRRFHRAAPLLGFFDHTGGQPAARFDPTSPFRPSHAPARTGSSSTAATAASLVRKVTSPSPARRHATPSMEEEFVVWDPTTDEQHRVPMPPFKYSTWNAALLCAAAGCDHFDCRRGHFLVVFVFTNSSRKWIMSACVYSSEQGAWSDPVSVHCQPHGWRSLRVRGPNALVKNAIYFGCDDAIYKNTSVLEYDLGKQQLSAMNLPTVCFWGDVVFMTAEGGGLGFAITQKRKLCLWSREAGTSGRCDRWVQQRVMELDKLLPNRGPVHHLDFYTVAIADDLGVVLIWADPELFTIDLRSSRVKKLGHVYGGIRSIRAKEGGRHHVSSAIGVVPLHELLHSCIAGSLYR